MLPGCGEREATEAMERVCALLELDGLRETAPPMTVSIGITVRHAGDVLGEAVARADEALARAKATGRNRIVGWAPAAHVHRLPSTLPVGR